MLFPALLITYLLCSHKCYSLLYSSLICFVHISVIPCFFSTHHLFALFCQLFISLSLVCFKFFTCLFYVGYLFAESFLPVHFMFSTCLFYLGHLYVLSFLPVRFMFFTCALYVFHLFVLSWSSVRFCLATSLFLYHPFVFTCMPYRPLPLTPVLSLLSPVRRHVMRVERVDR